LPDDPLGDRRGIVKTYAENVIQGNTQAKKRKRKMLAHLLSVEIEKQMIGPDIQDDGCHADQGIRNGIHAP
jgi:hypothetical protein